MSPSLKAGLALVLLLAACDSDPPGGEGPDADGGASAGDATSSGDATAGRDGTTGGDAAGRDADSVLIIPPDPRTLAPPLPDDDVVPFYDRISFLLGPIQLDVAPGAIEPKRAAVIVGVVRERGGGPLAGVEITVPSAPELGRTHTRADGAFDLVVNGGGLVTIRYALSGYLPVVRQISADWTDYAHANDVSLTKLDPAMTRIELASMTTAAIAPGSSVTDEAGTRRASLVFMPGTEATMHLPDGTVRPLTSLGVRATEYTVGPDGPKAMPADLPFASGYTYAIELSVDEALAAGATRVQFSKVVALYLDNYLGFAAGEEIPLGYYEPSCNAWIASPNGRIVDFIRTDGDRATLDLDGDGAADDDAAHAALEIGDDERRALARDRRPGVKLWRSPIPHFSAWDCNWSFGPPENASSPAPRPFTPNPYPTTCGSVLECQSRAVGQDVAIPGTPLALEYRTRRNEGGRRPPIMFSATESNTPIPENLVAVHAAVEIEGQTYETSFAPATNISTAFEWDGRDRYGRPARGITRASISVGYEYRGDYKRAQSSIAGFGLPGTGTRLVTGNDAARTITLWQTVEQLMPLEDTRAHGMGGFVPNLVERYDPEKGALIDADGLVERVISEPVTIAGTGSPERFEDTPESNASPSLSQVNAMTYAPDGSLFVGEVGNRGGVAGGRIRRLSEEGEWTLVAKPDGPPGSALDGAYYSMVHGPDGALYVGSDVGIYRIHPDGRKERLAGHDGEQESAFPAERSPALDMAVYRVDQLAVGPDCTVYFASYGRREAKIFAIGADGLVYTIAGRGDRGDGSIAPREGLIATEVDVFGIRGLAVTDEGEVHFADSSGGAIWRIDQGGQLRHVLRSSPTAPTDPTQFSGKSALDVPVMFITNMTFAPDGSLLFSAVCDGKWFLGQVTPDGRFHYVMPEPPHFQYRAGQQYAVGPRGELAWVHNAGTSGDFIKRTRRDSAGTDCAYSFPDKETGHIRCFDVKGRLTSWRSDLTGVRQLELGYDTGDRLVEVEDVDGLTTRIERDAGGIARAIVGPHGHRTELGYDGPWLSSVTREDGAIDRFEIDAAGLMRAHVDPRGGRSTYEYEGGFLTRATDAAGGTKTFAGAGTSSVTLTTAEGISTTFGFRGTGLGGTQSVIVQPDGLRDELSVDALGNTTHRYPDGTYTVQEMTSDPALGTSAPRLARFDVHTPGGVHSYTTAARTIGDNGVITDAISVNYRTYEAEWDPAARTLAMRTPMGRTSRMVLDEKERIVESGFTGFFPQIFEYDGTGNISAVHRGTRSATFGYDARAALSLAVHFDGSTTSFTRDPVGRITDEVTAGGSTIGFDWDPSGNLVALTPPGRPPHGFGYDPEDRVIGHDLPEVGMGPAHRELTRDLDGRPSSLLGADGSIVTFAYDAQGRLQRVSGGSTSREYGYGTNGRLESIGTGGVVTSMVHDGPLLTAVAMSGAVNGHVGYTYDADGAVTFRTVGAQYTSFLYDSDKLLIAAGAMSLAYDGDAPVLESMALGSVVTTFDVNGYGELWAMTTSVAGSRAYRLDLTVDAARRILEERETILGVTTVWSYERNAEGAIERILRDGVAEEDLTYDAQGNRMLRTTSTRVEASTYDVRDRQLTQGDWSLTWSPDGDLLTRTDGATGRAWTHRYDGLRVLEAVGLPDGREVSYVVDGFGRRVARAIDGVRTNAWVYDVRGAIIAEVDPDGGVLTEFVHTGPTHAPTFMVRGGSTYRLVSDARGSIRLVIDTGTGQVVQQLEYDRWGRIVADTNPGFQPFGFAAGLVDPDTGLVRFGQRDYDPELGRWTQVDPLGFAGGDTSLYIYGHGDPVSFVDPDGEVAVLPILALVGAGVLVTRGLDSLYDSLHKLDDVSAARQVAERDLTGEGSRNLTRATQGAAAALGGTATFIPGVSTGLPGVPGQGDLISGGGVNALDMYCRAHPGSRLCPQPPPQPCGAPPSRNSVPEDLRRPDNRR